MTACRGLNLFERDPIPACGTLQVSVVIARKQQKDHPIWNGLFLLSAIGAPGLHCHAGKLRRGRGGGLFVCSHGSVCGGLGCRGWIELGFELGGEVL